MLFMFLKIWFCVLELFLMFLSVLGGFELCSSFAGFY